MGFLLSADDRGILTLRIAMPDGELVDYQLSIALPGLSMWCIELRNLDNGERYRVGLEYNGVFRCSCPDYFFQKRKGAERCCKHCRAVRALKRFLDDMRGYYEQRPGEA